MRECLVSLSALLLMTLVAEAADTLEFEAVDLQHVATHKEEQESSDLMWLRRGPYIVGNGTKTTPASLTVKIPVGGIYSIWVCYQISEVRRKSFALEVGGQELVFCTEPYGSSPETRPTIYQGRAANAEKLIWTRETATLKAGDQTLQLNAQPAPPEGRWKAGGHPPLVKTVVITNDPKFSPPNS